MKKNQEDGKIVIKISILWLFAFAIILALIISFFKNTILASNDENDIQKEKNKTEKVEIEPNNSKIDILSLMVANNDNNQTLINEEREINYQISKEFDSQLPKGEEVKVVEGKSGKKQVIALQQTLEDKTITESIMESIILEEPVTEVIHVGTSEFLDKYKVHIGDDIFLTEKQDLKEEAKEDSETIEEINRYLNMEILEVSENWTKVKYKENEGYLPNDKLTSEEITPLIKEKNRIATLQLGAVLDMDLSKPSGLTLSDFKTVLSGNKNDKNNIFSENAEVFYKIEQEYQINGIFIAAIGIHESAWGNSYLAKEKKNLFGYKAYDRDPINSAQMFETYEECINTVAKAVATNYLSPKGSYYNGTTAEAVNTKYASDKSWYTKVFSYMEYLYDKLG